MTAATTTSDEQLARGLGRFLEEMDAFVASWSGAIRRFAAEPTSMLVDRDHPDPEPRPIGRRRFAPPLVGHDLMWDRELDG